MVSATTPTLLQLLLSSPSAMFMDKHDDYIASGDDSSTVSGWGNGSLRYEPRMPMYLPIYVTVFSIVIFMTGIVGNVLVILFVIMIKDMRTPMNWYLVNLSVADLLVLLVCQPAALIEFFARDRWYLGEMLCKLVPGLEHAALHASTLTILSITVERYYAICRPLKKLAMCHKPRPWRVLPVVWSVALVTAVPFVIMTVLSEAEFFDGSRSYVCGTRVEEAWHYWYIGAIYVVFFGIPMIVLFFLYAKIIRKLRSSGTALRNRIREDAMALSNHSSRKQVIKMLVGIVLLFFISLTPLRGVILWILFVPEDQVHALGPERYYNLMWFCRLLMYVNSAGNPIIYSLVSSKFQTAFWYLMRGGGRKPRSPSSGAQGSFASRRSSAGRFSSSGVHRDSATASLRLSTTDSPCMSLCQHAAHPKLISYPGTKKRTVISWLPLNVKSHTCSDSAHLNRLSGCGDAI